MNNTIKVREWFYTLGLGNVDCSNKCQLEVAIYQKLDNGKIELIMSCQNHKNKGAK